MPATTQIYLQWSPKSLLVGIVVLLAACKSPNISLEPEVLLNPNFQKAGETPLASKWWEELNSPELNEHIEAALANNLTLKAAWHRLRAAEALARRAGADKLPSLDGDADIRYRETESDDGSIVGGVGLAARYEVDFWGRIASEVEAQRFLSEAAYEDAQTLVLTISSEVALAWLDLTEARQRRMLLENQLELNQNIEKVLLARFSSGQNDSADVLRQRQLIESTNQQLFIAEEALRLASNRLQILKGLAPGGMTTNENPPVIPALPPLPDPGIPSELIQQRPDVRAVYFELLADDAQLAVAVAELYPRFDLSASLSTNASSLNGLFDTWVASVAGQLSAPLFDGDARRSEVDRRAAELSERVALYGQAILDACREIEDALITEASQSSVFESLKRELELNEKTNKQLRSRYVNGASDYLSLLINLRSGQQLQRDILSAQVDLLSNRVTLYRALASGLENAEELYETRNI